MFGTFVNRGFQAFSKYLILLSNSHFRLGMHSSTLLNPKLSPLLSPKFPSRSSALSQSTYRLPWPFVLTFCIRKARKQQLNESMAALAILVNRITVTGASSSAFLEELSGNIKKICCSKYNRRPR